MPGFACATCGRKEVQHYHRAKAGGDLCPSVGVKESDLPGTTPAAPPLPPDPDAAIKQKIAQLVAIGEQTRENLLGAAMLMEYGSVSAIIGGLRYVASRLWPAPTESLEPPKTP